MRFTKLAVENFRAITRVDLDTSADVVVVAGPNGCGKSSLFDAIRLLKSVYGGYQPNEWQSFFSEFQLDVSIRQQGLVRLFQNPNCPLRIASSLVLSAEEKKGSSYMHDN